MKAGKPKTVNEGNEFGKPNGEPTPVHRFVRRSWLFDTKVTADLSH
jgi:hypothetical protein